VKVLNAQNAGAIGVIVVNNAPGDPITMGFTAPIPVITIPSVMISLADGTAFNGRALSDDVIDAELGVTTNGCVTSDNSDASGHTYLPSFPYLGVPN